MFFLSLLEVFFVIRYSTIDNIISYKTMKKRMALILSGKEVVTHFIY